MVHVPARFASSTGSEPCFARRISSICLASSEISFGASAVFFASTVGCLLNHHTSPPSTIRAPIAVKSPPGFIGLLSPLPPDRESGHDHDQRQEHHAREEHHANGVAGDVQ